MAWLPIGPNFVFAPRNGNFKRLSLRNQYGRQGLVFNIAIDPTDQTKIYVVESPSSGGTSAFRSLTRGRSWEPIADSLQQKNPLIDPTYITVNPSRPEIIYMGTGGDTGIYISNNRGEAGSWGTKNNIGGYVRKIIIDPRKASTPSTTVLYAATNNGLYRSQDGGKTWTTRVLDGDITSLVAYIPNTGTQRFYAGVRQQGVFYTTDPTGVSKWTNLNTARSPDDRMLPAYTGGSSSEPYGNFDALYVDYCPLNPDRVYVWMIKQPSYRRFVTSGIYTSSTPLTGWTSVKTTSSLPQPYDDYCTTFAVSPNSLGDGKNDILFFGSVWINRSTDAGRTWTVEKIAHHADQHAIAFYPEKPGRGEIPTVYLGSDGGIALNTRYADPSFPFDTKATTSNSNSDLNYDPSSGVYQNLNHGKQSSAVYQYTCNPVFSAIGYIGCQDTGVNASSGSLGWRGLCDADGGVVATAAGKDGVKIWANWGAHGDWPSFRIDVFTDTGGYSPGQAIVTLGSGGSRLNGTTNLITTIDKKCLTGAQILDSERKLSTSISAGTDVVVTPSSMSDIVIGSILVINNLETVTVKAVTTKTFTADFSSNHSAGVPIKVIRKVVARIDQSGIASQISRYFPNDSYIYIIASSPINDNIIYCATTADPEYSLPKNYRLWMTDIGSTASSSTTWTSIAGNPSSVKISSIVINRVGDVYVLLESAVRTGTGASAITSPLFMISGNKWIHQRCTSLPRAITDAPGFGKIVGDPLQSTILYASHAARVYKLTLSGTSWSWQDISDGLPGQWIYDLWIGNVSSAVDRPKIIARAAIPTRGIWERDLTISNKADTQVYLYVRDNILDQEWLNIYPENVPNPYNPSLRVWHYQCADIKIDAQQQGDGSTSPFYQTDPESSSLPVSSVDFDQIKDNSQNLPQNDSANVFVQVHNRSKIKANNVKLWVIYCNASAGVPGLNVSPKLKNMFNFWSQFTSSGDIIPNLPSDSPWKSVGLYALEGIDASNPKIAAWNWRIPLLPTGDRGHYCMVVFVHSSTSPINEKENTNVDEIARRNKQIGQKNLHIGPPLLPTPAHRGGNGSSGMRMMREYIEFHNPTSFSREAILRFDLHSLPPEIKVSFQLTRLRTVKPLEESINGVSKVRKLKRKGEKYEETGKKGKKTIRFLDYVFEAAPSAIVEINGVIFKPYEFYAALLSIRNRGELAKGSEYQFEIQQIVKQEIVGGSTYVVRIEGHQKMKPLIAPSVSIDLSTEEIMRIEHEAERYKYIPPWAKEIAKKRREKEGGGGEEQK